MINKDGGWGHNFYEGEHIGHGESPTVREIDFCGNCSGTFDT